jgi:peroxiredoxin
MKNRLVHIIGVLLLGALTAQADSDTELNRVLSRLQTLSHTAHTRAEWDRAMNELDSLADLAAQQGRAERVVEARAIKAMALADMKNDPRAALDVLEATKREYGQQRIPAVRRLFIQQADYYGRLGDAAAVSRVIEEFKRNPNYDPVAYPVTIHEGRTTPMTVVRPAAGASDSTAVTAMRVARERASLAPGHFFPDASWTDLNGRRVSLQDLRGKVVLIDFWHQAWTPWQRDLANLRTTYETYRPLGFEVIGIALDRDPVAPRRYAGEQRLPWTLVFDEAELPRRLNLFGEVSSFLIDQNGIIIGRNLRGADLTAAVQKALGAQ